MSSRALTSDSTVYKEDVLLITGQRASHELTVLNWHESQSILSVGLEDHYLFRWGRVGDNIYTESVARETRSMTLST